MDSLDIIEPHIVTELTFEEKLNNVRWEVTLSDGTVAYNHSCRRSWLQLKEWLNLRPAIRIVSLRFVFRDNIIEIYSGEAECFFTNAVIGEYGGPILHYFIGGFRLNGEDIVHCKKYMVPEMFLVEEEKRDLDDASVKKGLIRYDIDLE